MSYLELAMQALPDPCPEMLESNEKNDFNEISGPSSAAMSKQYENNEFNEISGESVTAQNARSYLDSIALTTDMLEAAVRLAAAFPDGDPDQQEAAYGAYMSKADEVKAWQRAAEVTDPDIAREFDTTLRARMFAIRDEWRMKRGEP